MCEKRGERCVKRKKDFKRPEENERSEKCKSATVVIVCSFPTEWYRSFQVLAAEPAQTAPFRISTLGRCQERRATPDKRSHGVLARGLQSLVFGRGSGGGGGVW